MRKRNLKKNADIENKSIETLEDTVEKKDKEMKNMGNHKRIRTSIPPKSNI